MTTELLIVRSLERGILLTDFDILTMGQIMDIIVTYNNIHLKDEDKEDEVREATQSDYDNF